jgi:3-hydroxybutyrate dehydrogenase
MTLKGKCALVTGSIGGIGLATATQLAAQGCDIILNGFAGPQEIDRRRAELEQEFGVRTLYHGADLRVPDEIADLMGAASTFGGVDILVNNAVVRHFAPIEAFPVERWNEALAVNLSAAFHLIRLALPRMRGRNFGRIINMSSVYGHFATVNRIDYITTKTALLGMTRAVAIETTGHDITCNAICPGLVQTPAIETRIAAEAAREGKSRAEITRRFLSERQPTGRFVAGETIGALIVFLCGPGGRDITGAALPVDGGWLAS